MHKIKLAILGSTRGTDMQAIMDAIKQQRLFAEIKIVISNKEDAYILQRARDYSLSAVCINPHGLTREQYDEKIATVLQAHDVELVVLIGYMRILSDRFVQQWQNKIINVHPSLLPEFAGGMDQDVHQAVLDAGKRETGCTVHIVTEAVDAGPILVQKRCEVMPTDTRDTLKTRVQALEGEALIEAIQLMAITLHELKEKSNEPK